MRLSLDIPHEHDFKSEKHQSLMLLVGYRLLLSLFYDDRCSRGVEIAPRKASRIRALVLGPIK